jgi:hypothetical protein
MARSAESLRKGVERVLRYGKLPERYQRGSKGFCYAFWRGTPGRGLAMKV